MKTIQEKAQDILDMDGVRLIYRSINLIQFEVRQSNGNWCEVSKQIGLFSEYWFCNAITNKHKIPNRCKNKRCKFKTEDESIMICPECSEEMFIDKWGCVMNVKADKSKPYCSHCISCQLYLEEKYNAKPL